MLILGDLNCNVLGTSDPDGRALINFCSTFGQTQLVKTATRVTENSKSFIDVALTTKENIIYACDVIESAISDHSLMSLTLKFKTPRPRNIFVTTRTYKNYDCNGFIDDLANVPFHIVDLFDDPDDQVNAFNCLFLQILDEHAPIKRIRINSRPNPFITQEIYPCESIHSSGRNMTTLFTFHSITTGDVQRIITSLPSNKAPGCDKVNAKILKDSSPVIAPIIAAVASEPKANERGRQLSNQQKITL